jgi:ribosome-binding factor A
MNSRRLLKAAEAIREVVSISILTELRDPRIRDVTVTYVEVAPDMRSAKVHVSIMGSEARQNLSLRALQHAAGFLQQRLSERIITRYIPKLQFVLDKGVKNSLAVSRILREVLPPETHPADTVAEQPSESDSPAVPDKPPPDT